MIEKIKIVSYLFIAFITGISGVVFWGVAINELPGAGGKSGFFEIFIGLFAMFLQPLFNHYSVSAAYFILTLILLTLSFLNYKKYILQKNN